MARSTPPRRAIQCPRCDHAFEVSAQTRSTLCPGCHRDSRTEDASIDGYWASTEFYTAGDVTVLKNAILRADVRVIDLWVKGKVFGPVSARGKVTIAKSGEVRGPIKAATLKVEDGAVVVGPVEIRGKPDSAPGKAGERVGQPLDDRRAQPAPGGPGGGAPRASANAKPPATAPPASARGTAPKGPSPPDAGRARS